MVVIITQLVMVIPVMVRTRMVRITRIEISIAMIIIIIKVKIIQVIMRTGDITLVILIMVVLNIITKVLKMQNHGEAVECNEHKIQISQLFSSDTLMEKVITISNNGDVNNAELDSSYGN